MRKPNKKFNKAKVSKIMRMALELNYKGNATFVHFSGHVNQISVDIYDGEWQPNKQSTTYIVNTRDERTTQNGWIYCTQDEMINILEEYLGKVNG